MLDTLNANKKKIVAEEDVSDLLKKSQSISDLVKRNESCESFIREFLINLTRSHELQQTDYFKNENNKQNLLSRVSKLIAAQSTGELSIDEEIMNNIPINSDDPYFLASEVFRDTLLGFGVDEDGANNAKNLFLAIKKDKIEETSNLIFRIASKLDMESSQLCELKI